MQNSQCDRTLDMLCGKAQFFPADSFEQLERMLLTFTKLGKIRTAGPGNLESGFIQSITSDKSYGVLTLRSSWDCWRTWSC
jgi:hypothetical protein